MQHKTDQHWRRAPTLLVVEAALKTSENLRGDSERVGCAEVNDTACLHWLAHVYIVINNVSLRGDKVSVWHDDSVVLAFCPTAVKWTAWWVTHQSTCSTAHCTATPHRLSTYTLLTTQQSALNRCPSSKSRCTNMLLYTSYIHVCTRT